MDEVRRLAAKIDQHMRQLAAPGVSETQAIINRMVGYVRTCTLFGVGTSDQHLVALSTEFPGFYRYALLMEEASRPYDSMSEFSEEHKQRAAQLLATAATLERIFQNQVNELGGLHRQWRCDLDRFKSSLREHSVEPKALEYVNEAIEPLAERIRQLAAGGLIVGRPARISAIPADNPF